MNMSTTFSTLLFLLCAFNSIDATSLKVATSVDKNATMTTVDENPAFYISGKDVCVDEYFTIPVKVSAFNMITSFQFTIGWDQTMMTFDTISYVTPALGNTLLFNTMSANEGIITVSWYDINVAGVTIDDFLDIFQINFTAAAPNQTSIDVTFENEPTMKEVSGFVGNDIMLLNTDYIDGEVNIDQQELDTYEVFDDVNNSNVGGVNITIKNGTTPYAYMWSNDAETQNLENVGVGNYTVTVTDAKGCVSSFGEFTVDNTLNVKKISSLRSISLYPNPAKDMVHLNAVFDKQEDLEILIFSILGEKVLVDQRQAVDLDIDLNVSNLSAGTYFVQLRTADGFQTEKIQILR